MHASKVGVGEVDGANARVNNRVLTGSAVGYFGRCTCGRCAGNVDRDPSIRHTQKVVVREVVQTQQLDCQFRRTRCAVDVGIHVRVAAALRVPHAVGGGGGAAPGEVGGAEQLGQVDLVEIAGQAAVVDALEVGDDVHGRDGGIAPAVHAVVVVAFVIVVIVVAGCARGVDERVLAGAASQVVGAKAAVECVVTVAALDDVVALLAVQLVVAAFAEDLVGATAAIDGVIAADSSAHAVVAVNDVGTAAGVDGVVANC